MRIQGNSGRTADVNDIDQLLVNPETALAIAALRGDAYSWNSTELNLTAGDTILFVRNDSERPLILDNLIINGSNVICFWDVGIGNDNTVAAGTALVGINQNPAYGNDSDATAFHTETAVADASIIRQVKTPIDNTLDVPGIAGVTLRKGQYIQINQETTSDSGAATLVAHYG